MPLLTASDLHVDRVLTSMSSAFFQDESNFFWRRLAPPIPVQAQSDKYFVWNSGDFRRSEMQKRAEGTYGPLASPRLSTDSYFCERYSLGFPMTEEMMANVDSPLDLGRVAARYLAEQANIKLDELWVSTFFGANIWSGGTSGVAAAEVASPLWDAAGAHPIQDIAEQSDSIMLKTGHRPNKLVLGVNAYRALQQTADLLDRIRYVGLESGTVAGLVSGRLGLKILAQVFEVDEVIIAESSHNIAKEGQTDNFQFIMNPNAALLVYVNPAPTLMSASGSYTYVWQGLLGSANGIRVKNIPVPLRSADILEADIAPAMKLVAGQAGAYFDTVVT